MRCFALHPDALCRDRRLSHPATALFTPAAFDKTVSNVCCRSDLAVEAGCGEGPKSTHCGRQGGAMPPRCKGRRGPFE
jgi:hypothetical protein